MKYPGKDRRLRERLKLSLPARVQVREDAATEWTEMTRLIDLTPFGAGFSLTRPVDIGRLVHMTLPMPRQLRCFDHVEDQYRVYALVRSLRAEFPAGASAPSFKLGVAFVGKRPPGSYQLDPQKRYEVFEPDEEGGLWKLLEQTPVAAGQIEKKESRLSVPVEVTVELYDEKWNVTAREETVTENISRRGAAVYTTIRAERGRFVRLTSARYQTSAFAVVRASRTGNDGIPRLHVEFIDREWPLEEFG
ncbi:MAG: hypothetical protein QOG00_487 [Pyrinomonadaceae bacterium]|jgi:hypothetical protein|nr:hypothetical protein [Pyrinomonadaceae bacterium]MDQ1610556.1 hypothetical protein [Pyrinomonadaceae bacterium]MDX6271402.1 hypothetical protein [Acidobacteriota bacterium]